MKLGGELGGHGGLKWLSALLLVSLWMFFIGLSTWNARAQTKDVETQMWMIQRALFFLENMVIVFALLLVMATKFTKDDNGKFADQSVQTDFRDSKDAYVSIQDGRATLVRSWRVMVKVATFVGRLRSKRKGDERLWKHHRL